MVCRINLLRNRFSVLHNITWASFLMDDIKYSNIEDGQQVDTSLVLNCLQKGDAKLALQYCHDLLAKDPQHIQTLLFAALASRSLEWLDSALDFINRAMLLAPKQPAIYRGHILLGGRSGINRLLVRVQLVVSTSEVP